MSSTSWIDADELHIIGDVRYLGAQRVQFLQVLAQLYDADGALVGEASAPAGVVHLAGGTTTSVHIVASPVPAGYDHYELIPFDVAAFEFAYGPLQVTKGTPFTDASGTHHVVGSITNLHRVPVEQLRVWVTLLDGEQVLNAGGGLVSEGPLGVGASISFDIPFEDHHAGVTSYRIQSDGFATGFYITSWDNYFEDLFNSPFRDDAIWTAEQGISYGCSGPNYCWDYQAARAVVASFLARAFDLPATSTDFFWDDESSSHEADINRLAAAGITLGCGRGKFCPKRLVTRAEVATLFARALTLPPAVADHFTDDDGLVHHEDNINRFFEAGITTGCAETLFCPNDGVLRGEMAAFLHRVLGD